MQRCQCIQLDWMAQEQVFRLLAFLRDERKWLLECHIQLRSPEGGYEARALDHSIFTDGDDIEQLKANVKDAVITHFEVADMPKVIRLQ